MTWAWIPKSELEARRQGRESSAQESEANHTDNTNNSDNTDNAEQNSIDKEQTDT
jgi:hypothetical protein